MLSTPDLLVVINLEQRPDRLSRFRTDWATSGWEQVLGQPQVVVGVDPTTVQVPQLLAARPGVYGCMASHLQVLSQALQDGVESIVVLEDDVLPQPDSAAWLSVVLANLPKDAGGLWFDATMLGAGNRAWPGSRGTCRLARPPMRTHAYLLRRPLLEELVPAISRRLGHIDHLFANTPLTLPVYAAVPSLAQQTGASSDTLSNWQALYRESLQRSNASRWLRLFPSMM
jgi:GR25 family glycosyltransferase involved in LPS biosynthesis